MAIFSTRARRSSSCDRTLDSSAWWEEALIGGQGRRPLSSGGTRGGTGTLGSPMLTRLDLRGRTGDEFASALARPDADGGDGPLDAVREIIAAVRKTRDE